MTIHQSVLARLEKKFSRNKDAPAFEYIEHWLFNNRFMQTMSEDEMYDALMTSAGIEMYVRSGQIPEIDD